LSALETLWWLAFWTAVGLCVGSFLNAVIFRLPRNRSLRVPLWSACPHCHKPIIWYDNIPVLSFLLLGGRCRRCGVPIATRYPVVEICMAVIVLMLVDAFFIGRVREGLSHRTYGLSDRLAWDWPMLVGHAILFACLLAMSAIDLEHYWVDIRFTNVVTLAGFVLHTIWTPAYSDKWIRPSDSMALGALFALGGLILVWLIRACRPHVDPEDLAEPELPVEDVPFPPAPIVRRPPPSLVSPSRLAKWVALALLLALLVNLFFAETSPKTFQHAGRALVPLLFLFLLIVSESTIERASDHAITQAIHEERFSARRMVITELFLLLPAIALGILGIWLVGQSGELADRLHAGLHVRLPIHFSAIPFLRQWTPLYGLATAAAGYIIAGALGWIVRIVFTLVLGKEAFGTGDIHLMAAAGCVAGWPVAVVGFVLTCGLALLGWLICLPFKQSRALPLVPWLSLSFLTVVIFLDSILRSEFVERILAVAGSLAGETARENPGLIWP